MPSFCKSDISYSFSDSKIKDKLLSLDSNKVYIYIYILYDCFYYYRNIHEYT